MNLFDRMTNINDMDKISQIKSAILNTKLKLAGLTEERTCKIYNSLLLKELLLSHIPARLINTLDLGFNYEHIFILISNKTLMGGGIF